MSVFVKYWEWKSAEECLDWLLENHKDIKFRGSIHVWREWETVGSVCPAGGYGNINKRTLEGRIYSVFFINDTIGIRFHDEVFIPYIPNRSYPEQPRCVVVSKPTNKL